MTEESDDRLRAATDGGVAINGLQAMERKPAAFAAITDAATEAI